jgi:hypothetical protein
MGPKNHLKKLCINLKKNSKALLDIFSSIDDLREF